MSRTQILDEIERQQPYDWWKGLKKMTYKKLDLEKNMVIQLKPKLPSGKYNLGISKPIKRDGIYGDYLRRKVSS